MQYLGLVITFLTSYEYARVCISTRYKYEKRIYNQKVSETDIQNERECKRLVVSVCVREIERESERE